MRVAFFQGKRRDSMEPVFCAVHKHAFCCWNDFHANSPPATRRPTATKGRKIERPFSSIKITFILIMYIYRGRLSNSHPIIPHPTSSIPLPNTRFFFSHTLLFPLPPTPSSSPNKFHYHQSENKIVRDD